ncbi:hypothetical protein F5B22DRAFT_600964 [Xylaria bambusicola]|uniref:uncharacterized protein n=1 Tax=Xylaria bambusicola TaxID=326684 RepID=UPI002007986E|nr:uncharacterized protein F5B22DRAFT_600964 [Xylaria bambusicola]KAI0518375.1 hypothetical protein F5B22DRAFT_600964 [Xylaria bambusicola]
MALRALSSRLSAVPHHHVSLTRLRCPQRQWTLSPRFFSAEAVSHPSNLVQVYISRSTDPYLNLSIEHFLLQKSHPDSVVLLLYTNRPCIVIGRNQNPWVEVNLGLINQGGILRRLREGLESSAKGNENAVVNTRDVDKGQKRPVESGNDTDDDVLLVRRRSGGGTVFHDAGNVNYSVICPPALFDRNKHAEMVVRALQGLNKIPHGVRVNERHDIVLDVSSKVPAHNDPHSSDARINSNEVQTFKISGSAYKLTRTRSLHHGTCLLSSPHLLFLSKLLRSPAAPYIKARGVESVRSPVRNVGVSNAEFEDAVVAEFRAMYEDARAQSEETKEIEVEILDASDVEDIPEVRAGVAELRSRDWVYAQTPQFTFSSHPTAEDPRPRPDLPADLLSSFFPTSTNSVEATKPGLHMTVRHAEITDVVVPSTDSSSSDLAESLKGRHLHHIDDWRTYVGGRNESMGRWLNHLFGVGR